ncbi:hypothetical protein [Streptomyces fagopyri]|uniref:hypothetical protein n=1 Tax=Streptomyces fagopyri TaxID=2662397 RepID=UPI00381B1E54
MTSFVLPHEVHGDGAHRVTAVHGWSVGRSACAAVSAGPDRAAFPYALLGPRGPRGTRDTAGAPDPALLAALPRETRTREAWTRKAWTRATRTRWYPGAELREPARTRYRATGASPLHPARVMEPFPRAEEADTDRAGSEA